MTKFMIIGTAGAALLAASLATAQTGGGRSYQVTGFERVSSAGPQDVEVAVGSAASVRAVGSDELLDKLEVVVRDGSLEIRPKEKRKHLDWPKGANVTYYVTLPRITAASVAGSGDMHVDRVEGERFAASIAGSGGLDIARIAVDDADFSIAGSGNLAASGRARQSSLSIAGSGNMRTREVSSDSASVSVVGSGDVALTVRDDADISIMGSGDVDIAGSARCRVSKMGGGKVTCANKG